MSVNYNLTYPNVDTKPGSTEDWLGLLTNKLTEVMGTNYDNSLVGSLKDVLSRYNEYKSDYDTNGIARILEIKRTDGTLYQKFQLSNPNTNMQYQTLTVTEYNNDGTTVRLTTNYNLSYRAEDINPKANPISKVVV